jgi:hypothetical protein
MQLLLHLVALAVHYRLNISNQVVLLLPSELNNSEALLLLLTLEQRT